MQGKYSAILLGAALAAGLALGFAISTLAYRYQLLSVPGQNLVERLNAKLNLTPSQREQVIEITQDTRDHMIQLRHNFQAQRRRLMLSAYLKIHALLTPDQQRKFDRDFIPPRFRTEAEQLEREQAISPTPVGPSPSPAQTP